MVDPCVEVINDQKEKYYSYGSKLELKFKPVGGLPLEYLTVKNPKDLSKLLPRDRFALKKDKVRSDGALLFDININHLVCLRPQKNGIQAIDLVIGAAHQKDYLLLDYVVYHVISLFWLIYIRVFKISLAVG